MTILRTFPDSPDHQMKQSCLATFALLVGVLAAPPSHAQASNEEAAIAGSFDRKQIEIVRTDNEPVIDGVLDDELWQHATAISDMHQFQPVDHGEPSERSEFFIAYSQNYLYIGARLYDDDADAIVARQLVQGGDIRTDDSLEFILDTFNNGRTGYHFQVNPNGIRREAVFENPNMLNEDW